MAAKKEKYELIIAEKPSVSKKIAESISTSTPVLKKTGNSHLIDEYMKQMYGSFDWRNEVDKISVKSLQGIRISHGSYPLSWKSVSNQNDVQAMKLIDEQYVEKKIYAPNSRVAANILLKLLEDGRK